MSQPGRLAARLPFVDAARGLAIVAMATYHTAWDLQFLQLAPVDAVGSPAWRAFAQAIASTFLLLVGVSLVLSSRGGPAIQLLISKAFLRRLGLVAGAAALITVATYFATPDRFIFFGILHCIAVSSVLALPFLRAPLLVVGAVAAATIALPHLVDAPHFEAPALVWLGLGTDRPTTNDFVPIFPWFGPVLVGILVARLGLAAPNAQAWWRRWRAETVLPRGLALAGRHSLPIYLLHQPLILALLWLVLQVTGPNPAAEMASFTRACIPACLATGDEEPLCRNACACMADALKRESLWNRAMQSNLTGAEEARVSTLAQQCRREP